MDFRISVATSLAETAAIAALSRPTMTMSFPVFLALVALQYLVFKIYRILIYPFYFSPLRNLPGPKNNTFLLGQVCNLYKADGPIELQLSWMRQWPDAPFIRYLSFLNTEILLVNSLQAHKEVLQTNCYAFVKPKFFERLVGPILGKGLVFEEGEAHKQQRRLLAGPFSFVSVKKLLPVFQSKTEELTAYLNRRIRDYPGEAVEVTSIFERLTLDIIGETALGEKLHGLSSFSYFHECYSEIFEQSPMAQLITVINMYIPLRSWLPLAANRRFVNAITEVRGILRKIIKRRKNDLAARQKKGRLTNDTDDRDILTFMIQERLDAGSMPWTEDDILGHCLNFLAAGHETTSGALIWAIHTLSTHPAIQSRLRTEIQTSLPTTTRPSYADIENLPYLANFAKELFRFYSPSIGSPRESTSDLTIADTFVPKGTPVVICNPVPHFNPLIWGPSADAFDPDRHDNVPAAARDPFASQSFLQGPRICIGKAFAILEFKTLVSELVRRFSFERVEEDVRFENGITLRPRGGLRVRIAPVDRSA